MRDYEQLQMFEDADQIDLASKGRSGPTVRQICVFLIMGFCAGIVMTVASLNVQKGLASRVSDFENRLPFLRPPGHIPKFFTPNRTFWLYSEESDLAWQSILPNGLGFVQHPLLGPEIVGLAFVHQLHCVDLLHQGYLKAKRNEAMNETDRHVTHCLEYLRQSVICNADSNLEKRNETGPGVIETLGDGEHQCKDFDEVKVFAEKWRVFNGQTVEERTRISDAENVPGRVIHYDYVSSRGDPMPV